MQAIELAGQFKNEIHLLLTDVVMPQMNGGQLHQKLLFERPGLKALFMSGYAQNIVSHHGVLDAEKQFLPKPFSSETLARMVRQVLDATV